MKGQSNCKVFYAWLWSRYVEWEECFEPRFTSTGTANDHSLVVDRHIGDQTVIWVEVKAIPTGAGILIIIISKLFDIAPISAEEKKKCNKTVYFL